jgi:hypothetical protein
MLIKRRERESMMANRTSKQEIRAGRKTDVAYPRELEPFIEGAPLPVLVRSCVEWMVNQAALEQVFAEVAKDQYTRELTLTFLVDCMLDVACGIAPSALKALEARQEQMEATCQAFYTKLRRMETGVSAAVVKQLAGLAEQVISQLGNQAELIDGYRTRVVDGTLLGGRTENRIKPLRTTRAAGLTGIALAVFAPALKIITQVVLEEDAYTQERALLSQLEINAGQVWIGDRNFCVRSFLFRIHRAQSVFLVRWHASSCPYQEIEPVHPAKGSTQGAMEHRVWLQDPETQEWLEVRRIVLPLEKPTRNGDTELILVTDLPETNTADDLCEVYAQRWKIEVHYQRLTQRLNSEPPGFNYPRAALFAFAMAVTAGNALAVVQQALQVQHGKEAVQELSYYSLVLNISQIWLGMAIVVPTEKWKFVRNLTTQAFAHWLCHVAKHVPMDRFRRSRRGPKKPHPKTYPTKSNHFSIKRLLDQTLKI